MNNKMAINTYLSTIEFKKQNKQAEQKQNNRYREFYLFLNYFIIVQLQLSAFSPHPFTPPQPNPPPSLASTFPLGFVHASFIVVPENPSPHCPFPRPLWLFLDCS